MFNKILVFGVLVIVGMIGIHRSLQSGALLRYMDAHSDARYVAPAEYYIGQGYYLFQDLPEATTYFARVSERFPQSPFADGATFSVIRCLEDSPTVSRMTLAAEYEKYVERFPGGKYVGLAQTRIDSYRSGAVRY